MVKHSTDNRKSEGSTPSAPTINKIKITVEVTTDDKIYTRQQTNIACKSMRDTFVLWVTGPARQIALEIAKELGLE